MKIVLILISFCCLLIYSCSTSYEVMKVGADTKEMKSAGIFYSLPKNNIQIRINTEKTRSIEGPYAPHASKYLGIKNTIKKSSTSHQISSANFNITAVADPAETYFIILPSCIKKKNQLSVHYSADGTLSSINTCPKQKREVEKITPRHRQHSDMNAEAEQLLSISKNLQESYDTIIERVLLDSLTIEKKILKKIMIEKTPEQKAKETADLIMKIRDERFKLYTGYAEVNYSEGALAYMDNGLAKMEQEYMRMFTGMSYATQEEKIVTINPSTILFDSLIPICRFSTELGILDSSFYSGEPIYIKITNNNTTADLDSLVQYQQTNIKHHGICYRIPKMVNVQLIYNDDVIASQEIPIAQFGQIVSLPAKKLTLTLNPKTGTLRSLKVEK